jgi:hypothetical protein
MPPVRTDNRSRSLPEATPESAPILPSEAELAFKAMEPRLAALPRDALAHVNVDLQTVSVFALGIARVLAEPAVRARFARLASTGEYQDASVDDLGTVAQAAWYARHRFLLASALHSDARIAVDLLDEATTQRARMLKVAEYWLSDDPGAMAEIAAIRAGTGYQDLANDLIALGSLFERHAKLISQDKKLYQRSDATTANRLGGRIVEQLGASATQEQTQWSAMQPRVWTLLLETYDEVRRGGLFLFARDRAEERFPPLSAVGRTPGRSSKDSGLTPPPPEAASSPNGGALAAGGSGPAPR